MRAAGMRPVQIWVPDTRSADFATEARRQSLAAAVADRSGAEQDWVESASAWIWNEDAE